MYLWIIVQMCQDDDWTVIGYIYKRSLMIYKTKFAYIGFVMYICKTNIDNCKQMDIVSRLKFFLEKEHISNSVFADNCKIARPTLSQLLTGRNKKVSDEQVAEVKALLEMMGPVEVDENFVGTRWSKLLINASFSGMSAVLGCTFGEAAGDKESRRIVQKLIKECIDVCAASDIRIEPIQGKDVVKLLDYRNPIKKAISFFIIPIAIRKHAGLKASMLQDIERGKKTEVDAINGAVCSQGRKVNVPTPCNDKVVELIHRIENGELTPCRENVLLFK